MKRIMMRQGDILLVGVAGELPQGSKPVPREGRSVVLAHGEATNHRHRIDSASASLYEHQGQRLLRVDDVVELRHEEHSTIVIKPGLYRVVRQREYVPRSRPRDVED